ncbi:MAG: hypothetical protein M1838_004540 [Thelocarpon superellum]|nr:MAG: hypothetical protein M1838_004540 [Thelocarpon superellum]
MRVSSTSPSSSPVPEETIQIFVKSLAGETISITVSPDLTISTLLTLLSVRSSVPTSDLRLVFAGKHLSSPTASLADYSIQRESTLHLALPLRGGMPPKKQRCTFKDCKDGAQRIVGDCGFCGGHFCGKHRLLEDHKCDGLEDCKRESHDANANKLISERTTVIKGI